jgi:uncharacterized protein (TIGR02284 family)
MENEKLVDTLNNLIETCRDGQNGFKEAADNVKNPELKRLFNDIALERGQFAGELQQEVRKLGGDPEKSGSAAGAIHRTWMKIKGTLTGKDDHSILNECERGEDSAVEAYQDALKSPLPTNILVIARRQFENVKVTHDRIKKLRDAKAATPGR